MELIQSLVFCSSVAGKEKIPVAQAKDSIHFNPQR